MSLMPRLKIAQTLPIVVAGVALIASATVGIGAYLISANTVTSMTEEKLATVAMEQARQLTALLQATKDDLLITAASGNTVSALANQATDRRRAAEDLLWTLLNHPEFLFQH